jgi:DNA-binding MarR family transcriptional regulator
MARNTTSMPRRKDEESGQFTEQYPREDFIAALPESPGASGTSEIADEVGCDRRTAYQKLNALADEGEVNRQKIGQALVWQLPAGDEGGEDSEGDR